MRLTLTSPFLYISFFFFVSLHRRASDAKQTNFCRINGVFFPFALLLLLCVMLEPCMANIFSAHSINRNSRKLCGEKKNKKWFHSRSFVSLHFSLQACNKLQLWYAFVLHSHIHSHIQIKIMLSSFVVFAVIIDFRRFHGSGAFPLIFRCDMH